MARSDRLEQSPDDRILQEARDRFKRCQDWEQEFRKLYVEDVKFANGDSDNGYQWPNDLKRDRDVNQRPSLTINKVAQHVLQITNDARQNKPSVVIKPAGEEVSYKSAQVYEGLVREIERRSKAQAIYDDATESQVEGGIAYWRVITEYVDEDTFDQQITIAPVRDHMNVYVDPDIKQKDGSDAKFAFVYEELPEDEWKRQHPGSDAQVSQTTTLDEHTDWVRKDNIRVAEYYRIVETKDELIFMRDEFGASAKFKRSEMPPKLAKLIADGADVKRRPLIRRKLEWYKIAGDEIVERRELPGKYIPIVRLPGREKVIEGKLERKGHVRTLKDPQRMWNYNSSGQVEYGALATKTPWVVAAQAVEGNEREWANANRLNAAYLPYKHKDEDGDPIPPPVRPEAPGASPAFIEGMRIAGMELEMASGQYQAQMGAPSNERSGRAIAERQRQGDNATYHFIDALGVAIEHTGRIIIDLVPHIYDTARVIQILAKDGTQTKIHIQPDAETAFEEQKEQEEVRAIFNPNVGKYSVEADIGPAYSTQRQETWNAFVQITAQNPEIINILGDLMYLAADFPLADKIAERFKRQIQATSPWLLDPNAQNPMLTQLQQEVSDKTTQIQELLQKLAETQIKVKRHDEQLRAKDEKRGIDAYDAESRRIAALGNAVGDVGLDVLRPVIRQVLSEMLGNPLTPEQHAIQHEIDLDAHLAETGTFDRQHEGEMAAFEAANSGQAEGQQ
jgi:hypothetical protein